MRKIARFVALTVGTASLSFGGVAVTAFAGAAPASAAVCHDLGNSGSGNHHDPGDGGGHHNEDSGKGNQGDPGNAGKHTCPNE